jgi:hypothetical protein
MIHERASSVKMGPVPISLTRVWAPAFSPEAIFVHNPELHGLVLKRSHPHKKLFGNSAREIGLHALALILSSLFVV